MVRNRECTAQYRIRCGIRNMQRRIENDEMDGGKGNIQMRQYGKGNT